MQVPGRCQAGHGNCCMDSMAWLDRAGAYLLSVTRNTSRTAQMAVAAASSNPAMLPRPAHAAASRLHAASMAAQTQCVN